MHEVLAPGSQEFIVSILVFVELALDEYNFDGLTSCRVFQSLFSWNLLLMSGPLEPVGTTGQVSILVFVELALDVSDARRTLFAKYVSILVFVELALDVIN